jgi:hypothetical protein
MTYCYFITSSWAVVVTATLCDYCCAYIWSAAILLFRCVARVASVLVLSVLVLALLSSTRRVHVLRFDVDLVLRMLGVCTWVLVCSV